jgi:formylglycine-generating enzyme required for sulfatase activity
MVLIDAGTIEVGRSAAELDRECAEIGAGCDRKQMQREVPRQKVLVPAFFLDRHEVTNEDYAAMLNTYSGMLVVSEDEDNHYPRYVRPNAGTLGSDVLIDLNRRYGGIEYVNQREYHLRPGREKLPVPVVSWYGARLYCESQGKRLPTEDEWEAAARGRDDRRFPWGNEPPRCGQVVVPSDGEIPMPSGCAAQVEPQIVGSAAQDITPDGVHDLGGNVSEWTSSVFVEGNRGGQPPSAPREAPRVMRGGSWGESLMARSSGRNRRPPSVMGPNLGFRCASNADAATGGHGP